MTTKRKRHEAIRDAYPNYNAEAEGGVQPAAKYKTRLTVHAPGFRVEHIFDVSANELFDLFTAEAFKDPDLMFLRQTYAPNSGAMIIPASVFKNAVIEIESLPEDYDTSTDWI